MQFRIDRDKRTRRCAQSGKRGQHCDNTSSFLELDASFFRPSLPIPPSFPSSLLPFQPTSSPRRHVLPAGRGVVARGIQRLPGLSNWAWVDQSDERTGPTRLRASPVVGVVNGHPESQLGGFK